MLHKFMIASHSFILCLFGLTLVTVSSVFADDSAAFVACHQMHSNMGAKEKKNCFKDLARSLQAEKEAAVPEVAGAAVGEIESYSLCTWGKWTEQGFGSWVPDDYWVGEYARPCTDDNRGAQGSIPDPDISVGVGQCPVCAYPGIRIHADLSIPEGWGRVPDHGKCIYCISHLFR